MISRREVLSWLGASAGACAVGAGSPLPVAAAGTQPAAKGTRVVSLESFYLTHADHGARLHAYLGDTVLPQMRKMHRGPRLCLEAIVAPYTPQAALMAVFSSFDEVLDTRARLASNRRVRQRRAELELAGVLEAVRSQLLLVDQESLHFPADLKSLRTGVLEVRSYDAPAWHEGPPEHVIEVLRHAGVHPIVNAATAAGEHVPRFTYVIPFENLAAREQVWTKLDADPEWIGMQREWASRHGSPARVTSKSIYKLVVFSQLG